MNRLTDLANTASEKDCERMLDELGSFRDSASLSDDAQQRILSSVMKKAGYEMNNAIHMTEERQNRQNRMQSEKPKPVSVVRRGHNALAACIVLAVVAAAVGAVIFGGKLNTEPGKPDSQTSLVSAAGNEQSSSNDTSEGEGSVGEEQTAVPDITGLKEEEARKKLEEAGFVPVRLEVYDNGQEEGNVAYTDPAYGNMIPKGSEVCYFVSLENYGLGINFDTRDKQELYEIGCRLYDNIMKYHGDTIERYNAENGTTFSLEKPQIDFSEERLREMDYNYNALMRITADGMYDYIAKSFMTGEADVPDVIGLTEEEAVQKLKDAGFVPFKYGVEMTYGAEGRVTFQRTASGEEPEKGSLIGYSISKVDEVIKAVPDYDGDAFDDGDISVKVEKLICDGSFFIVGYTMESRTETWKELNENYHDHIRFADTGEELEYYDRINYNLVIMGSNRIGVIDSYMITPEMRERGIMLDICKNHKYDSSGNEIVTKSDKKDRLLNIPLECNVPTRTLTSEDGISIVLSPMGISSQNYDGKSKDVSGILKDPYQDIFFVTKDGQRIEGYDYYPTEGIAFAQRNMEGKGFTDKCFVWCFFGFKDIDNVESVEINGVVFR